MLASPGKLGGAISAFSPVVATDTLPPGPGSVTVIDLGTLGGSTSVANGINAAGQVVGYSGTAGDAANHAAMWIWPPVD